MKCENSALQLWLVKHRGVCTQTHKCMLIFFFNNNADKSLRLTKWMSRLALKKKKSEKPAIAPQLLLTSQNRSSSQGEFSASLTSPQAALLPVNLWPHTAHICTASPVPSSRATSLNLPGFSLLFLFLRHTQAVPWDGAYTWGEALFLGGKLLSRYSTEAWPSLCPQETWKKVLKELGGGSAALVRKRMEWDPTQDPQGKGCS